ncbi:DUF6415 family natural product biosynthesis protein [Streptomyces sp. NPDC055055]
MPPGPAAEQSTTAGPEGHAAAQAERAAAAALALPHTHGAVAIAATTNRLLTHLEHLITHVADISLPHRPAPGTTVLNRWETLKTRGPAPDPLGNWSYMRDLAHLTRDITKTLHQHHTTTTA